MADSEDRTQAATGHHLGQARAQGNVPLSHDLSALASLCAGLLILLLGGPYVASRLLVELRVFFIAAADPDLPPKIIFLRAETILAQAIGPSVLGTMLAGLIATWLQTGFLFHLGALKLDISRLSPARGFARIFSSSHLVELLKSVVKITFLGYTAVNVLLSELPLITGALVWSSESFLTRLLHDVTRIVLAMVMAQSVIVAADFLWVRIKHQRDMRMSLEDVKQEHKDMDGDPRIKSKRKRIRYIRHRRRMMANVKKATVIITNPTHYAVALVYERGKQSAPRVVAKGIDEVAANIRAIAEEHRVPIVRNVTLARALYLVELDAEIPAEHFQAAAEIIAYVWRLKTAFRSGNL